MTLKDLDKKYNFNLKRLSEASGVTYGTVVKNTRRKWSGGMTIRNARRIINVLPITPEERAALIESLFAPSED